MQSRPEIPIDRLKQIEAVLANPVLLKEISLPKLQDEYEELLTRLTQDLAKHALNLTPNNIQLALNEFQGFMIDDILTTSNHDERLLRITRYIELWTKGHNSGNYFTSAAIYNALHHPDIKALTKTFASLSESAKTTMQKLNNEIAKKFPGQSQLTAQNVLTLSSGNRTTNLQQPAAEILGAIKEHVPLSTEKRKALSNALLAYESEDANVEGSTKIYDRSLKTNNHRI